MDIGLKGNELLGMCVWDICMGVVLMVFWLVWWDGVELFVWEVVGYLVVLLLVV